jgi:hypothetical protein
MRIAVFAAVRYRRHASQVIDLVAIWIAGSSSSQDCTANTFEVFGKQALHVAERKR